jgi:DNA-binding LacI/PurR family transcriptional regulator
MKKDTRITIKDIADLTGVSVATISRVMNHKRMVKEDTRKKVLEAMERLNFNPSSILLTHHTSRTILLCVPDFSNPFNGLVIDGIQQSAYRNQYRVLILQSKENYLTLDDYEEVLKNHSFAGIILLTSVTDAELLQLLNRSCPIVMCSEYCDVKDISFVSIDDITAACRATEYLIGCGCKNIALLNSDLRHGYARHREQGYSEALKAAGMDIREDRIVHISSINYELAFSYTLDMLNRPDPPDAFFAVSDVFASAAIHAAKKMHLRIPEDLSVIGFDNIGLSCMIDPPITTVEQPSVQIGYQSCELLIERIKNPKAVSKGLILDTQLIVRDSTMRFSK